MNILNCYYLINNKKISSLDFSKYILKKIENLFFKNFFINLNYDFIIKQSVYCDYLIKKKKNKFLTGIPIIYKDIFSTKILKTTSGSRILKNYFSPYNSTIINRLKNIGLINFGKTNMDEFGVGSNSFNFYYGRPKNTFNNYYTSGGSSGGNSYLISKKLIPFSIGTDTGGSVRQPAALNNLIGFKPTYGRISRYGIISYSSSMDNIGITCNNVFDICFLMNSISGFDIKDQTTFNFLKEDFSRYLNKNWLLNKKYNFFKTLFGLLLGFSKNFFNFLIDKEVKFNIELVLNIFEFLGAEIIYLYILFFDFLSTIYYLITSSEVYSNLSRYNNFLYYNFNFFKSDYQNKNFLNFSNILKNKIFLGNYILSSNKNKKYFFYSKKIRRIIFEDIKKNFLQCDIILLPVIQNLIWYHLKDIEKSKNFIDFYSSIANISGFPSVSIPSGFYYKNVFKIPLSFQIIGNYFKEARLIQIIYEFQKLKCF